MISTSFKFVIVSHLLLLSSQCSNKSYFAPIESNRERSEFVTTAKTGVIATAHPLASDAGQLMLKKGGNAVDAAVAASFVLAVVRPHHTGLGGGGFMLSYDAKSKKTLAYDFRERAPLKATEKMYLDAKGTPTDFMYKNQKIENSSVNGHLAAGVPGMVAGTLDIHKKYGKLPLKTVLQPSIDVARNGFKVYRSLAAAFEERKNIMVSFEGTREIFFPKDRQLRTGDTLVQKDLASSIEKIAVGGKAVFYNGALGTKILEEMKRGKGIISQKDLSSYSVKLRQPVIGSYRGFEIVSMPPPSSGGVHIIQMLNILEGFDLRKSGHNSTQNVHLITESMRLAFADRAEYLGDPDFVKVPTAGLLSKKYAEKLRGSIDLNKATPSSSVRPGKPQPYEKSGTTHLSVVDQWGNAVSTTQTLNYKFGSCVVVQGTGILLNDEMDDFSKKPGVANTYGLIGNKANAIAAKKTMLSSMSPTFVFDSTGNLTMAVGASDGPRIITSVLQTIINYIDFDMPIDNAVHSNRIHHQWLPDELKHEPNALSSSTDLQKMGYVVKPFENIGVVQAVALTPTKDNWMGVSDTRAEGAPRGNQ